MMVLPLFVQYHVCGPSREPATRIALQQKPKSIFVSHVNYLLQPIMRKDSEGVGEGGEGGRGVIHLSGVSN